MTQTTPTQTTPTQTTPTQTTLAQATPAQTTLAQATPAQPNVTGPADVAAAARGDRRHRAATLGVWALQVLTAAVFVLAAVPKLTGDPQLVASFAEMGLGSAATYAIGVLELAGAVGLLIPRLCGVAAVAFVALMTGAVLATLVAFGPGMVAVPAAVLGLATVLAWARRRRAVELVRSVRGRVRM